MGYYELYKMGTLYLGDDPQSRSTIYWGRDDRDGSDISIRDTYPHDPSKTLTWVRTTGLNYLMCRAPCLRRVSWNDLKHAGFVEGKVIKLNGWLYRCRMPRGSQDDPSHLKEWNNFVRFAGGSPNLLDWKYNAFWSADCESPRSLYAFASSPKSALSTQRRLEVKSKRLDIGFWPLLEPLKAVEVTSGSVVTLDGIKFGLRQEDLAKRKDDCVNFAPMLYPIKETQDDKTLVNDHLFDGIQDMRAYTLLLNGKPVSQTNKSVPSYKPGATLELTDKFFGEKYLISWRVAWGCARPVRTILSNVPLDVLRTQNLL